jgi:sugar/nucleoside kinase (ribokinase family)
VLAAGEALWDLAAPLPFAAAESLALTPGGAAVNVALSLSRRGLSVALAAVVGADALGEALCARVAAAGVDVGLVAPILGRTELLFTDGARFVGYRAEDEPPPRFEGAARARALLLTGILPGAEHARAFAAAARRARAEGALVMVDLNARPRMWRGRDAGEALAVVAEADVVKASVDDAAVLGLGEPVGALRAILREDAALLLTAGPAGARAVGSFGDIVGATPRLHEGRALGAGDAFTAGAIAALLSARPGDAAGWARVLAAADEAAAAHLARC